MKAKRKSKKDSKKLPETIEERVHRHINDINSKITDDDIRSVRTELDIRNDNDTDEGQEATGNNEEKGTT
jgi:hypothetical protein